MKLGIVVDGPNSEVYGMYDFGNGEQFTKALKVTSSEIESLSNLGIWYDYRFWPGYAGAVVDNLKVTQSGATGTPEPGTIALMLAGALAGAGLLRRRRK